MDKETREVDANMNFTQTEKFKEEVKWVKENSEEEEIIMEGVREYAEEMEVVLAIGKNGRFMVNAYNEGGFDRTCVDLIDLIDWLKINLPSLLK